MTISYEVIYENAIAQEFHAYGHEGYYFRNKKIGEIDFLVQYPHCVLPIKVKSGKTYKRHGALTGF